MIRRGVLTLLLLVLLISSASAKISADFFQQFQNANRLYQEGKYLEAAEVYEKLVQEKPMAEVYYNLGNAYFKGGKLGLSVLSYLRARNLSPRDRDLLANFFYVTQLIEYKIEDKRNWHARKVSGLLRQMTFEECKLLCFSAYFLFILGLFLSLIFKKRPLFGNVGRMAILLVVLCSLPLLLKYAEFGSGKRGVVTEAQSEVRYGPSMSDRIAFRLVEGLEVVLDDEKEDWYRIRLRDGRSGWTAKSQVTAV